MSDGVLYATEPADRFFIVPPGFELPAGDLRVIGLDGRRHEADGAALAPFEVTEADAREHLRARAERAIAAAADTLGVALGLGPGGLDPSKVAERIGVRGADLKRDPAAARAAVQALADDVAAISAAVASGSAADLDAARARLAKRGIDLGDTLDALPAQLETLRRLDQADARKAAASSLRTLADALEQPGAQPLGRRIDELIDRLDREVGPWLGKDPEKEREQRQQEYERDARSAIADSLRAAGITPLNDPKDS